LAVNQRCQARASIGGRRGTGIEAAAETTTEEAAERPFSPEGRMLTISSRHRGHVRLFSSHGLKGGAVQTVDRKKMRECTEERRFGIITLMYGFMFT